MPKLKQTKLATQKWEGFHLEFVNGSSQTCSLYALFGVDVVGKSKVVKAAVKQEALAATELRKLVADWLNTVAVATPTLLKEAGILISDPVIDMEPSELEILLERTSIEEIIKDIKTPNTPLRPVQVLDIATLFDIPCEICFEGAEAEFGDIKKISNALAEKEKEKENPEKIQTLLFHKMSLESKHASHYSILKKDS